MYTQKYNTPVETLKAHIMNNTDIPAKWDNDTLTQWDIVKAATERLVSESVAWHAIRELRDEGVLKV